MVHFSYVLLVIFSADTAVRGFMGSAISVQPSASSYYGAQSQTNKMAQSAANKQVFTETGM